MKQLLIFIVLLMLPLSAFEMNTDIKYTGWPSSDSTLDAVIEISADSVDAVNRNIIQVMYVIDISEASAGRVRQGLIEGGKKIVNALRDGDRFGIVVYSEYARTLLPMVAIDSVQKITAIDLLERINTESGRNLSNAMTDVNREFSLRAGENTDGRFLIVSSLGTMTAGETGDELKRELLSGTSKDSIDYVLYTVGYGNKFDEDLMISAAEDAGGQAFFVPQDRPDSLVSIFEEISDNITSPVIRDIDIYINFPDSDIEACHFGTDSVISNPYRVHQLSKGETYRLLLTLKNRPERSASFDVEVEYHSIVENSRINDIGGTKISLTDEQTYTTVGAPSLINFSVYSYLSDNIVLFRRVDTEMTPSDGKTFRQNYADQFQEQIIIPIEIIKNTIGTPEMESTYQSLYKTFEIIRDGTYDTEYSIRRIKYNRHYTIHGK